LLLARPFAFVDLVHDLGPALPQATDAVRLSGACRRASPELTAYLQNREDRMIEYLSIALTTPTPAGRR